METISVNDARYDETMAQLYDVLAGQGRESDCASLVEDEARLWLKQAIGFTPPKVRAQGENAIKSDVNKLFSPVDDAFAAYVAGGGYRVHGSESTGNSNIDLWLHNSLTGQSYEVQWGILDPSGTGMDTYHTSQRNSAGRVSGRRQKQSGGKWLAKYVVGQTAFDAFEKKIKDRVGMMKSGWVRSFYEVGGKVQGWIERHLSKNLGSVKNELSVPGAPSITMINHAPGIHSQDRIARETFRARRESMVKRMRLIISGYGKDIASGQKPHKKSTWAKAAFGE